MRDDNLICMTDAINALENKTILTASGFHLSLTKFYLKHHPNTFLLSFIGQ